ncbi:MAG: hypothetical protein HY924_15385 [Elusimicrobia bacterium]|nr:hypothetical protein [Elusimicrobiota bacterium]
MDILLKLRVLIWVAIISLWGVMVYQYLGEEELSGRPAMAHVPNPYKALPPTPDIMPESAPLAADASPVLPGSFASLPLPPAAMAPPPPVPGLAVPPIPPKLDGPATALPRPVIVPEEPAFKPQPEAAAPIPDLPAPAGFTRADTRHFLVFAEGAAVPKETVALLENLHGNLMLDMASFSPWASDEKVTIYLFKHQETYRRETGRPVWSGGATSIRKRKVYLYESPELPGILAHELCHIYYDSFFLSGKPNPLWLSEGVATLIQVERGLAAPVWLRENLHILKAGGGYALADLMRVSATSGAQDAKVRLWYAQSYSLVRFLMHTRQRSAFYHFSRHLRDGRPVAEALYRSYGAPYTSLKALELAWRYDVQSNR